MLNTLCIAPSVFSYFCFFFFNDTATTEIYTLSLHDALPISCPVGAMFRVDPKTAIAALGAPQRGRDRKSTRLNSSHSQISYAVFCLKKKKKIKETGARTIQRSHDNTLCMHMQVVHRCSG